MEKKVVARAVAAAVAMFAAQSSHAGPGIEFDTNGGLAGGLVTATTFNWINAAVAAIKVVVGTNGGNPTDGVLYGQGSLDSIQNGATNVYSAPTGQFTFQFAVPVQSTVATGTIVGDVMGWAFDTTSAGGGYGSQNYFRIFYDPNPHLSVAAGTGFGDSNGSGARSTGGAALDPSQKLILEAKVTLDNSPFSTPTPGPGDPQGQPSGIQIATPASQNSLMGGGAPATIRTAGMSAALRLDVHVCKTAADADDPTVCAAGGASTIDTSFFTSEINSLFVDFYANQGLGAPVASGHTYETKVANLTPDYGAGVNAGTNNFSCTAAGSMGSSTPDKGGVTTTCDIYLDSSNMSMTTDHSTAPEPLSVALLGLGLFALGTARKFRGGRAVQQ